MQSETRFSATGTICSWLNSRWDKMALSIEESLFYDYPAAQDQMLERDGHHFLVYASKTSVAGQSFLILAARTYFSAQSMPAAISFERVFSGCCGKMWIWRLFPTAHFPWAWCKRRIGYRGDPSTWPPETGDGTCAGRYSGRGRSIAGAGRWKRVDHARPGRAAGHHAVSLYHHARRPRRTPSGVVGSS